MFPLPGGSATVILRPENRPDGSFVLVSEGDRFGDAGYYREHRTGTDHAFRFMGLRFLDLHYEITPRT